MVVELEEIIQEKHLFRKKALTNLYLLLQNRFFEKMSIQIDQKLFDNCNYRLSNQLLNDLKDEILLYIENNCFVVLSGEDYSFIHKKSPQSFFSTLYTTYLSNIIDAQLFKNGITQTQNICQKGYLMSGLVNSIHGRSIETDFEFKSTEDLLKYEDTSLSLKIYKNTIQIRFNDSKNREIIRMPYKLNYQEFKDLAQNIFISKINQIILNNGNIEHLFDIKNTDITGRVTDYNINIEGFRQLYCRHHLN